MMSEAGSRARSGVKCALRLGLCVGLTLHVTCAAEACIPGTSCSRREGQTGKSALITRWTTTIRGGGQVPGAVAQSSLQNLRPPAPAVDATSAVAACSSDIRGGVSEVHDQPARDARAYKKALTQTALVVIAACAFGVGTGYIKGKQAGLEFFAGYLVEQSLSVDNLFVFIMLFDYFKVPPQFQNRVLTWGILGAVSMRAVMIVVGVAAIQRFRGVILFFAALLCVSAVKLLTEGEDHGGGMENNFVLKVSKYFVKSTDHYDGENFFTLVDGVKRATPLLLCLVCIELSDFVFAVDSIPAVLGVSKDPFIVYTSNVFAIAALRSLYTLVNTAVADLPYLKPSVALVLGFVGIKMCLEYFHHDIGIGTSLSVVGGLLAGGTIASLIENRRRSRARLANDGPINSHV